MRLVPLIYGLVTWLLLRLLLVAGFGRELGTSRAVWALLVAYLLWWLPYGITLRPEPLIVLLAAATLLLTELARRRGSVGALSAATATAALAMSVSPSGLVAGAPLVLALPWLWAWLRAQHATARVAAVLALTAAGTSLVIVGFADATLGDVLESTAVHQWYYWTYSWYEEFAHYQTILSRRDSSQWARRAPVVLTIAVLLIVAMGKGRRSSKDAADRDSMHRLLVDSTVYSAVALALLAPTPTKWVNHFGAVAVAPTMLLTAALLRSPPQRGVGVIRGAVGTVTLVGAMSLSFAGPNLWRPYSDRGQPFGDHLTAAQGVPDLASMRPKLGPVQLANPAIWVAVALATACAVWWWYRRGRDTGLTPDRSVLLAGSIAMVVMTIVVFVWAPVHQYPGWSVALTNAYAARGESCLLASHAQVLVETSAQPVPTGPAITTGAFTVAASRPAPVPAPAPGTLVWHDAVEGGPKTGLLVTPWFTLPADGGTDLLIPLSGTRAGQQLTLQYSPARGTNPAGTGNTTLSLDLTGARTEWQQAVVALDRLGTRRPSSVRLVIRDQVTDADSWLAVGQPRLATWRSLTALAAEKLVYVDQVTAALLPCLNQVGVVHGISRAPQMLVLGDEGFSWRSLDLGFEVRRGGTQVPADRSATTVRVPSRLVPSGPPTLPWGRIERVIYDHPVGLVDLHIDQLRRNGWTRLPTLAAKNYHGNP